MIIYHPKIQRDMKQTCIIEGLIPEYIILYLYRDWVRQTDRERQKETNKWDRDKESKSKITFTQWRRSLQVSIYTLYLEAYCLSKQKLNWERLPIHKRGVCAPLWQVLHGRYPTAVTWSRDVHFCKRASVCRRFLSPHWISGSYSCRLASKIALVSAWHLSWWHCYDRKLTSLVGGANNPICPDLTVGDV